MTVRGLLIATFWCGVCFALWSAPWSSLRPDDIASLLYLRLTLGISALLIGVGALSGNAWNTAMVIASAYGVWIATVAVIAAVFFVVGGI